MYTLDYINVRNLNPIGIRTVPMVYLQKQKSTNLWIFFFTTIEELWYMWPLILFGHLLSGVWTVQ